MKRILATSLIFGTISGSTYHNLLNQKIINSETIQALEERKQEKERIERENEDYLIAYELEQNRIYSVGFVASDITRPSYIKAEEMSELLSGTNMKHLANDFVEVEQKYGINAILLASLAALESAWNTSDRAIHQNNLTGYAIYSDDTVGPTFPSPYYNLINTGYLLVDDYIDEDGRFYTGPSIYDINKMYSSDKDWAKKINQIADDLMEKYDEIYRNM